MAATQIDENLRLLHRLLKDSSASAVEQIDSIIADLTQVCQHEVSGKDLDYCCSVLFDKEIGVITFLQKIVTKDEFQSAKASLLDLVSRIIMRVEKKILPYAPDIKDISVSLFSRDRFAKVKNAAIPLLIKLLEVTVGSDLGEELKVDKIIEKFFNELLTKGTKMTPSVKGGIYHLLGVIAEIYPVQMTAYADRLLGIYLRALKAEMTSKTKKAEMIIIAKCLEGLTCLLTNFTHSAQEDSKNSYEIFQYVRMGIDPGVEFTRYDTPRAGLVLLSRHAAQFDEYLLDDYQGMYEKLHRWSQHGNKDLMHLGMSALEAVLKEIALSLVRNAKEGQKEGAVFKFFIKEFRSIMNNPGSSAKQVSLAIRGYGLLAAPCRSYLTPADVQFMFSEMVTKSEQQFFGGGEDLEDKLYSLPSYLYSLGNIIKQIDEVSDSTAASVERLLVLQLESIPLLNPKMHFDCLRSLVHVLLALRTRGAIFRTILSGLVYQGLIRTCSHPVVEAGETEEMLEEAGSEAALVNKVVSYRDYLSVWTGLLDSPRLKMLSAEDMGIAERHSLTEALYDQLMAAVLKVIKKLNLTASADSQGTGENGGEGDSTPEGERTEVESADPTLGVHASKPQDFVIFINLVEFCRALLPTCQISHFQRWIYILSHNLILLSSKHPLVSGFYKLLSVAMVIAKKLQFFKGLKVRHANPDAMEVDEETEGIKEKFCCYLLIKKFSKEVLVRMKQYRDDLLAACLTLILSLPREIVIEQLKDVVPAIQVALTVGLSYLPLALTGLEALEYWSAELPRDLLCPLYPQILPFLDPYLCTADHDLDDGSGVSVLLVESKRRGASTKTKIPIRLTGGKALKKSEPESSESQLATVQQRILQYLGSLGGSVSHALLAHAQEDVSHAAIAWDSTHHLRFDMPFVDMKPSVYFDPFLPRVVELALTSSERRTRVAACELLHSLLLYGLGRSVAHPGDAVSGRPSMQQLYKKLFPAVLQLACDVEEVCRQLFEPLTMQLIHWFTNAKMAESPETMTLLDAIYDGVIQPSNTALRDFSARCLREFMAWSIKQTSKKLSETSPVNAKSLLKRMFSFALHPSAMKRLGAALTFNNIYTVFREEVSLVDRFSFQILVHFVESLAIAHRDEKALGTQDQCVKALDHLQRIICVKADLLRKDSKQRDEPREWNKKTLDIAVRWLVRQCGRPQTECRHVCMKMVFQLAPLIQGIKSTQDFFQTLLKSGGPAYFIERFEGGGKVSEGKGGLSSYPKMETMSGVFSLSAILEWFDLLLAVLDCYTWIFGEGLLSPAAVFTDLRCDENEGGKKTKVWEGIQYFLDQLSCSTIQQVSALFPTATGELFTPREEEDYNRAKCTVIIRLWNFLTTVMAKFPKEASRVLPEWLWGERLWEILCLCVVQPQQLGFNLGDVETMDKLPQEVNQVLLVLTKHLPKKNLEDLTSSLGRQLQANRNLFERLPLPLGGDSELDVLSLGQLVAGYGQLLSCGLLLPALCLTSKADQLAKKAFSSVFEGIVETSGGHLKSVVLPPNRQNLASQLLQLAFRLELKAAVLVEALLSKTAVAVEGMDVALRQGDLFFSLFKSTIAAHIAQAPASPLLVLSKKAVIDPDRVSAILVATLDHVGRDRDLRKKCGEQVAELILGEWNNFRGWWSGKAESHLKSQSLMLLTKLLLIHSKVASSPTHPAHSAVFSMYLDLLNHPQSNLAFKIRVLDLLPFFAVVTDDKQIAKLKESLDGLVANCFPLRSSELTAGSPPHTDYINAIDKLLGAMELSGSPMLLELIISIFCREQRHSHEEAIQAALGRFARRLPQDKQKAALDIPYGIFVAETRFPTDIRRATLERVCLPLLQLVRVSALKEFFMDHIVEIMKILDVKLPKSPEVAVETGLVNRLCCFQLLELLYSRLDRDDVNSKNSVVNDKFTGGSATTGKELTQKATKTALEARNEDVRGESTAVALRRQYHCHAHNLLIAIISCVQTEAKFYEGFLFKDNPAKRQFLLENLVDTGRNYEFKVELTAPVERKKKFVSLRNEARESRRGSGDDSDDERSSPSSSFNLASLYLADSSLSEDLNQFDFSMSGTGQSGAGGSDRIRGLAALRKRSSVPPASDDLDASVVMVEDSLELEMDDLNQHECMVPLVALLRRLISAKIYPEPAQGVVPHELPGWMQGLYKTFCSASTHINIKLFIAKLITNTAQVFQPYASFWLRPLSQLIVGGRVGEGLNTLVVDILVTMLSWHSTAIPKDSPEERALASKVVEFLIVNIYHETRPIFRNNLELLKTVLECWQTRLDIPYHLIYKELRATGSRTKADCVGIQILGAVMAAKFAAYGPCAPVDRDKFLQTLANGMANNYKAVYGAAAEVVGMVLKQLEEREKLTEGEIHDLVANVLTSLHSAKPTNFITCLHRIQRHCPQFADRFLTKLLFVLPKLHGENRTLNLEVVLSRVDQVENVYRELKSKGLHSFLTHRDEATQAVALKIVQAMASKLQASEMLELLPLVTAFYQHPSASCRTTMYHILMWIYDNYRDEASAASSDVVQLTKDALLRGMADEDLHCRLLVQNFWSSETRLPGATVERLAEMLKALYSPATEPHFLSYATGLLMEMTSKSPDYNRPIFEHPLSECKFQDISIKSDWRQRHAAMTPLFASTLATQTEDSGIAEDSLDGQLRATMDVQQFSATQGASRGPYNWLTQSSLDTFSDSGASLSMSESADSSLLFTTGSQEVSRRFKSRPSRPRPGFGQKLTAPQASTSSSRQPSAEGDSKQSSKQSSQPSEIWRLKRRFIRDQEASQVYFARKFSRLNQMREVAKKERMAKRENQVTLYRKYRIGDLPDIQINFSYIIAPLQALAQYDNTVARLLFGSVFKAIYSQMDKVKTEREMEEVKQQMSKSLKDILSQSTHYFTPFMSCILDILYHQRDSLRLEPASIGTSARASSLQALGTMVLEEGLIQSGGEAPPAKRGRTQAASLSPESKSWIELARLYKTVGQYDVLQGIFSSQAGTKEITQRAMAAESRGDFKTAKQLYTDALGSKTWTDGEPQEVEMDFWDDGRMECLNKLSQWTELDEVAAVGIDSKDLTKIWEDGYSQEHYLPWMMRAKMKLLLQGDEGQQPLLDFVDAAMKVTEHRALLESRYPMELSLMYMWQEDYDRARFYCTQASQRFLQTWSSTDALMANSRASQIQQLQPLQELQEFLHFVADQKSKASPQSALTLAKRWEVRLPHPLLDSVSTWDDVVTNRAVFLEQISSRLASASDSQSQEEAESQFQTLRLRQRLAMAESCCQQNNFSLGLRILKETHSMCKSSEELLPAWSHLYAGLHHRKSHHLAFSADTASNILTTLDQLDKCKGHSVLKERQDLGRRQRALMGAGCQLLALGLASCPDLLAEFNTKISQKLALYADCKDVSSVQKVLDGLTVRGYRELKDAVGEDSGKEEAMSEFSYGDSLLALAKYCDKFLRRNEDAEDEKPFSQDMLEAFPETVVVCMLRAMKHGCSEARDRYPRLLQLVDVYPSTRAAFVREAGQVPSWMFLAWVSQMMALLDKAEAPAVHAILERLATDYPQAVIYPFRISCEGLSFEETSQGLQNKAAVEKLASLLVEERVPLVSKFISGLDQFGQPDMLFKDWADDVAKLLKNPRRNREALKKCYLDMYNILIADRSAVSEVFGSQLSFLSPTANIVGFGEYRRKFADIFRKDFDSFFGKDGKKLLDMSLKDFQTVRGKLMQEFEKHKDKRGKLVPPTKLREYCQWMAEFKPSGKSGLLEIPGQYSGLVKPLPEYHVKVAGFDERVMVMSSLRKPKRITIRGNDEKEYHYLVKGGEDLRLDQRIEQLFTVANGILAKDAACSLRSLQLKTYQVIPMTPRVGLIEWISHTVPLKNFLESAMTDEEKKYHDGDRGPTKQHQKWTGKFFEPNARGGAIGHMYQEVYRKYSRTETVKEFHAKENKVPWDLSRRAFHKLSTCPEAFHVLRNAFATSHAALCICQYILGIGDRHLSNFMVSLQTGQMIGIDFGHAFGSATQFLPVPELMPFRLTRQIVNVTLPLKVKGLMESTMVHVLRAIRADYDLLLNTMDVFVKEPSVDWLQLAERQVQAGMKTDDADTDMAWYPRQKIQYAERKLKGDKPSIITRDELRLGHSKRPSLKDMESVVLGDQRDHVRATLPETGLTEEQQVAALIDQATDPNLLGRVWAGWEAWM